jgi:lysophospholipase L1-like esterase
MLMSRLSPSIFLSPQPLSNTAVLDWQKFIGFGNSITLGVLKGESTPDKGYIPRLEILLNQNFGVGEVTNDGKGGETTKEGLSRIDDVLNNQSAKYLLLMEGTNDMKNVGIPVETAAFNLEEMAKRCIDFGTSPAIASIIPNKGAWDDQLIRDRIYSLNDKIQTIASDLSILFVDQFDAFYSYPEDDGGWQSLFSDRLHPNETGYQLMAEKWFEEIKKFPFPPPHQVSKPNKPNGPSIGEVKVSLTFTTGGSICSRGHKVEYRFDWGDGEYSTWSSSRSASHSWSTVNIYTVRAQARCSADPTVLSDWSAGQSMTINPTTVAISGDVKSDKGDNLSSITISFSNDGGSTTTDLSGHYSHNVPFGWSGIATPSKIGYTFSPSHRTYANLVADQTNQDYTASLLTFVISGRVIRITNSENGEDIEGVSDVTILGMPGNPITDESGNYSVTVEYGWTGSGVPFKEHYTFSPSTRSYSPVTSDMTEQNFTALRSIYAPLNFTGKKEMNRSLSQVEYINVLSWLANPDNENITKYRIYLVNDGNRDLVTEVNANTFEYWHRKTERDKSYSYALVAVNDENREGEAALLTFQ